MNVLRKQVLLSILRNKVCDTRPVERNFTYQRRLFSKKSKKSLANMAESSTTLLKPQIFDYLLVLDFEATCDNQTKLIPQEIIEFPVLKVNPVTLNVESTFHRYVCPQVHKELTPFCIELTGIIQDMVDGQPSLQEVLQEFDDWMKQEGLLNEGVKFAFVTCGDWDLKLMLPKQCAYFHIKPEDYFNQWINLKRSFSDVTSIFPQGMMPMLSQFKLKHQGRHHSGIDDCKNIANIVIELLKRGYVFKYTGRLKQPVHST